MSRIRTIKPDFWRNDDLSSVSAEAALLAIGLLNFTDDEGFFIANTRLLRADIFPLRELSGSVPELLLELEAIGFVRLFSGVDGKQYGEVSNFRKHQVISKPTPSKIKQLSMLPEDYGSNVVGLPLGKEGKGKEEEEEGRVDGEDSPIAQQDDELGKSKRATRFDPDFQIPDEWIAFAKSERPDLDPLKTFARFRDFWVSKSGKDATKMDWMATWRNWVRNEKGLRPGYQGQPAQEPVRNARKYL